MKLYQRFNNQNKNIQLTSTENTSYKQQNFSTPFQEIGSENLSLPYIDDRYKSGNIVLFGQDNLMPQKYEQLFLSSPLHSGIIRFLVNATVGSGYHWKDQTSGEVIVQTKMFEKKYKLQKLLKQLTLDFSIHNRMTIIVTIKNGNLTFKRVKPTTIRTNETHSIYEYSKDWSTGLNRTVLKPYNMSCKEDGNYVISYQMDEDETYPFPYYNSALSWIYMDSEVPQLHKANIQNSIFPSLVLLRPKEFTSEEEKKNFYTKLKGNKGKGGAGNVAVFAANGKDELPELKEVSTSNNDKLFLQTTPVIQDGICQAHSIPPILMGIRVPGSLGNTSELETAYNIYAKDVIIPTRNEIEEFMNNVIHLTGIKNSIVINNFQLIDKEIVEIDDESNKIARALGSMSPLLSTKILESMSTDEIRALAGLKPLDGGIGSTPKDISTNRYLLSDPL
jgi:hypothetical protein